MMKWTGVLRDILTELINSLFFLGLLLTAFRFMGREPSMALYVLPAEILLFYYALRRCVRSPVLFYLLHLPPFLFVPFLPDILERVLSAAMFTIFLADSVSVKRKGEDRVLRLPAPAPVCSLAAAYYVTAKQQLSGGQDVTAVLLAGIAFYYLRRYLDRLEEFVGVNEQSNRSIPVNYMLRSGGGRVFLYTAAVAAFLSFTAHTRLSDYLNTLLSGGISRLLTAFFSRLHFSNAPVKAQEWNLQEWELVEGGEQGGVGLLRVLFVFICAAGLFFLLRFLRQWIARMLEAFAGREKPFFSQKEEKCRDEVTRIRREKKPSGGIGPFIWKPEEKIRRIYRYFMEEERKKMPEEFSGALQKRTAGECIAILREKAETGEKKEALNELLCCYEKARYAPPSCGAQDVRRMRAAVKRFRCAG